MRIWIISIFIVFPALTFGQVYLNEKEAGEDYSIQGEYIGKAGGKSYGIQVISWGNGTFESVILPGGLPGKGWGKDPSKFTTVRGKKQGNNAFFKGEGWQFTIESDGAKASGFCPGGDITDMNKVFRESPSLGMKPPTGATVLFDGTQTTFKKNWSSGKIVDNKFLSEGSQSKPAFKDHTLHIEFRLPFQPKANNQDRGNSGVYVQGRYEIQVLDSYGWMKGSKHGAQSSWAGGIYGNYGAKLNMSYPPLRWQTYDIRVTHPRYKNGKKIANMRMTVWYNGVKIHDDIELANRTRGSKEKESPAGGKLFLQDHGSPVWFKNIWVAPGTYPVDTLVTGIVNKNIQPWKIIQFANNQYFLKTKTGSHYHWELYNLSGQLLIKDRGIALFTGIEISESLRPGTYVFRFEHKQSCGNLQRGYQTIVVPK